MYIIYYPEEACGRNDLLTGGLHEIAVLEINCKTESAFSKGKDLTSAVSLMITSTSNTGVDLKYFERGALRIL